MIYSPPIMQPDWSEVTSHGTIQIIHYQHVIQVVKSVEFTQTSMCQNLHNTVLKQMCMCRILREGKAIKESQSA